MNFSIHLKRKTIKLLLLFIFLPLLFLAYSYIEFRWLKVTYVQIESGDIPPSFNGKRIVFFSDVHHGKYFSQKRVASLVDQINGLKPDIIIIGGDNVFLDSVYIYSFFYQISRLRCKYGIYEVLGNHDCYTSKTLTRKMIQQSKINNCSNKSYWIKIGKDSIKIGGIADNIEGKQISQNTTSDVRKHDFCILISHRPGNIPDIKSNLIDLTLSGHTHGGQITFFGLWAPILPSTYSDGLQFFNFGMYQKYRYGLIKSDNRQSYVTSGVGGLIPFRFFCRPEIVVLELKRIPSHAHEAKN